MNLGDLNKVWEIKTLKRKPKEEEARNILDRVAKQVQPIMRKHKWRVKVLSEFCPKNRALLGLNVGGGIHVKLRLRRANIDDAFLPFHEILDTMLHELCHNVHGPHNASFYKLWDEIRKECEDLIHKGISGEGIGFDLPGKRLGGGSRRPLSSHRQAALAAAENRARLGSLLPSGPKKLGGDNSIMAALSPVQAAAMAAERRLRDNIWCGSEFGDAFGEDEFIDNNGCCSEISSDAFDENLKVNSRKRSRDSDEGNLREPAESGINFIDLTGDVNKSASTMRSEEMFSTENNKIDVFGEASTSSYVSTRESMHDEFGEWQCMTCTLLNPPLAPICEVCSSRRPKDDNLKSSIWSCKFCTFENDGKLDNCGVCGAWRYSYGAPAASSSHCGGT